LEKKNMDAEANVTTSTSNNTGCLYGASSDVPNIWTKANWEDWNRSSGSQGYWLMGIAALLIVFGIFLVVKKPSSADVAAASIPY